MKKVLIYFSLIFLLMFATQYTSLLPYGAFIGSFLFFLCLLLPGLMFREIEFDWFQKELFKEGFVKSLLISLLGTSCLLILFHFSWVLLSQTVGYIPNLRINPNWIQQFTLIIILNTLAGALVEELIFRGFIQDELIKAKGASQISEKLWQILVPSVLFGLIHVFQLQFMCWIIIFPGIYFSLLKLTTKHISGSILAHLLFNLYYFSLNGPKPF